MTKELILIDVTKINAVEVFSAVENLDPILKSIAQQALSVITDASNSKGREEIRSLAYKIAQSKTALDDVGKNLTVEWKAKVALVDSCRKQAREFLDDLKVKVRQPLTDFENAEAARIAAEKAEKERLEREERERIEAERIKAHQDLVEREAALQKELNAKNAELNRLQEEARQRELAEQQAREQAAREERLKADEAARVEAEWSIKAERERLEEEKRIADVNHQNEVKQKILAKLTEFLPEEPAFLLINRIEEGSIPNLKIIY